MSFFTSEQPKRYKLWSCQKMCNSLHYLLDNIFIRSGSKLYRQIVGIPIVTPIVGVFNCSMFCCTLLYVHFSFAIILMGKRELVAVLSLLPGVS